MAETRTYLTLKRAAQRLGVHEQTLRSWEKRGLIRMVRLPASGYRRVPAEEVDRLEKEMSMPGQLTILERPNDDPDSSARAQALADAVRAELAELESSASLDELMASRRGRTWSS